MRHRQIKETDDYDLDKHLMAELRDLRARRDELALEKRMGNAASQPTDTVQGGTAANSSSRERGWSMFKSEATTFHSEENPLRTSSGSATGDRDSTNDVGSNPGLDRATLNVLPKRHELAAG